jgi:hypothetical protein
MRRVLASLAAAALTLGAFAGLSVDPVRAAGAPTVSYTSAGPVTNGTLLTVVVSGFPAEATVAVSQCPSGIQPKGPGDCAAPSRGGSRLAVTDAAGGLQTTLNAVVGPLGSTLSPDVWCTPEHPCSIYAVTVGGTVIQASTPLVIDPATYVEPVLSLDPSKRKVQQGKKVTFSGDLAAVGAVGKIVLERKKARGPWRTAARTSLDAESEFSFSLRMKNRAWKSWRAVMPERASSPYVVSKTVKVKVKPKK